MDGSVKNDDISFTKICIASGLPGAVVVLVAFEGGGSVKFVILVEFGARVVSFSATVELFV